MTDSKQDFPNNLDHSLINCIADFPATILKLFEQYQINSWVGTASDLINLLHMSDNINKETIPNSFNNVGKLIKTNIPSLKDIGIEFGKTKQTKIKNKQAIRLYLLWNKQGKQEMIQKQENYLYEYKHNPNFIDDADGAISLKPYLKEISKNKRPKDKDKDIIISNPIEPNTTSNNDIIDTVSHNHTQEDNNVLDLILDGQKVELLYNLFKLGKLPDGYNVHISINKTINQ